MKTRTLPRLGRWAPITAAILGSAALAGPAWGQAPAAPPRPGPAGGGAPPAPAEPVVVEPAAVATVVMNRADLTVEGVDPDVTTLSRDGVTIASGDPEGSGGAFGLNSAELAGEPAAP